jgi:CHAD domain-containing protein
MAEKPAVRPDAAVGAALEAVARDVLSNARAVLDDRNKPDAVAVHDLRKALKRWRALLRLVEPFLGDEARRLRMQARDLARDLSGARDAQSAIEALEDLGDGEGKLSPRTIASIHGRLDTVRLSAEAAVNEDVRARLRSALQTAVQTITAWNLQKLTFADLARELARTYQRLRGDCPKDWDTAEPETLHDLRTLVVAHRYQMELVAPLWPRFGKLWVSEAQRLRDRLGAFQDLSVLLGFTVPHAPLAPWRSRITPLIVARQAKHAKAAERLANRLLAERPKAFRRRLEALWDRA